ncbi:MULTISPECIES: Imm6 family immunity protein [unclassified Bacillus (in: firmicutes)]|uniref:Imm6 family immunity protein n=1 Tax=unclassified Bacillus (in: firmicutes) TaxID=185979 RepID=UPI0008EC7725|nr:MULTISPECIES: Imm6 family immunity protein [unclassified Bacillus (in: firmicutes)]SFJ92792.1 Immunity protein Imm6 [Bacillus sp. 71mf]SFS98082.1 Immunity protein Imm6 [Bacillus sp. 103mf]
MMDFIESINENAKVVIGLIIAESMFELIGKNDNGYKTCREALDSCWKWLEDEEIEADDLCGYIDGEDYLNLATLVLRIKDKKEADALGSVLYAVSYTTWQAYKKENDYCFPQPIEVIDDTTLVRLTELAIESKFFKMESLNEVKKHLLENYPIGGGLQSNTIIKEDIMKMVDNNY